MEIKLALIALIGLQGGLVFAAMHRENFSSEEHAFILLLLVDEDNDKQELQCNKKQKCDEVKSKIWRDRYAIGRQAVQLIKNGISHLSKAEQKEIEEKAAKYSTYLDKRRVEQAVIRAKQLKAIKLIQTDDISHFSEKEQQAIVRDAERYKRNAMVDKARRNRSK